MEIYKNMLIILKYRIKCLVNEHVNELLKSLKLSRVKDFNTYITIHVNELLIHIKTYNLMNNYNQ